jgi:aquaglyceroporin related protein
MATTQQAGPPAEADSSANPNTLNHADTGHSTAVSSQLHPIRARLGLKEQPPIDDSHDEHPHQELLWSRIRMTLREPFAEFWGTAVMVFFGNGSVAQVVLSQGTAVVAAAPGGNGYGAYQSISWGCVSVRGGFGD